MSQKVGLWIDHVSAFIVYLKSDMEAEIKKVDSDVEPSIKSTGGGRSRTPYSKDGVTAEKSNQRRRHQIKEFFDKVIENISDAEYIYLFGPGQAKKEISLELKNIPALATKVLAVEPADKMTEPQIIAKVKNFYKLK